MVGNEESSTLVLFVFQNTLPYKFMITVFLFYNHPFFYNHSSCLVVWNYMYSVNVIPFCSDKEGFRAEIKNYIYAIQEL